MNILTVQPDFTIPAPAARHPGSRVDLAKPASFSSTSERPQFLGYPSPPMSDSPSPTRRSEQHARASQIDRRPIFPPNGLPPLPSGPFVPDQAVEPQRPLLPQYTREPQPQQQYPPPPHLPPPPQHSYQAPHPPAGPFTYHHQPGAPMHAPAFYPSVPAPSYHAGYHGELPTGPSYVGNPGQAPQGSPAADHSLRTTKTARRTKAHVASACVNCKKAHLSCDAKRPCTRCVASNKQDSCYDVPHKKRGRPRLREDRAAPAEEPMEAGGPVPLPPAGPAAQAWPIARQHRRANSLRVLRSQQRPDERPLEQYPTPISASQTIDPRLPSGTQGLPSADSYRETRPVAFLNIDLVILKSNGIFQDLCGLHGGIRGRSVGDLMEPGQTDLLSRLRNELRDERDTLEPAYMPPINPHGEQVEAEALDPMSVDFVESLTQQRYRDHHYTWNFRLRNGRTQPLNVNVRLAKKSFYFVALIVQPFQTSPVAPSILGTPVSGLSASLRPSGASPRVSPASHPREFAYYDPTRPSPTSTSGPPSPFNFQSVATSLPQGQYQAPSYSMSPTTRGEPSYITSSYQAPHSSRPLPVLSTPYQTSSSRPPSATSEPSHHRTAQPRRPESLQLPPLRGQPVPPPLASPQFSDPGNAARDRVRRREVSHYQQPLQPDPPTDPSAPDSAKRRRLNIHEVLD